MNSRAFFYSEKIKMKFKLTFAILAFVLNLNAQIPFRIESTITVKEITSDGKYSLSKGLVYFDKNYKKLVYNLTFPNRETLVLTLNNTYKYENNKLIESAAIPGFIEFTIYNLALNGDLKDFGIQKMGYTLGEVEKSEGQVISTWLPPKHMAKKAGKILISQLDGKLKGVIIYDTNNSIVNKQIFENYIDIAANFSFPTTIYAFNYAGGKEVKQITTYSNVTINNLKDEALYNYALPAGK